MTIIIARHLCPFTRGVLKRWFIEPKPNTFVGSVNCKVFASIMQFIRNHDTKYSMIVFIDNRDKIQGFEIMDFDHDDTSRNIKRMNLCGLDIVTEKSPCQ